MMPSKYWQKVLRIALQVNSYFVYTLMLSADDEVDLACSDKNLQ